MPYGCGHNDNNNEDEDIDREEEKEEDFGIRRVVQSQARSGTQRTPARRSDDDVGFRLIHRMSGQENRDRDDYFM